LLHNKKSSNSKIYTHWVQVLVVVDTHLIIKS
jgi:hypothetical protein